MFPTINNEVMGVSRCQTMPHIRHCCITSPGVNEPYARSLSKSMSAFVLLAAKWETRPWYSPSQYPKLLPVSSVTHDIAEVNNYSLYRRYRNNCNYNICLKSLIKHAYTVKPVLSGNPKIDKTKVLKTNGSLMKVKSIAEPSQWSIL